MEKLKSLDLWAEKFPEKTAQIFIEKKIKPKNLIYWKDDDIIDLINDKNIAGKIFILREKISAKLSQLAKNKKLNIQKKLLEEENELLKQESIVLEHHKNVVEQRRKISEIKAELEHGEIREECEMKVAAEIEEIERSKPRKVDRNLQLPRKRKTNTRSKGYTESSTESESMNTEIKLGKRAISTTEDKKEEKNKKQKLRDNETPASDSAPVIHPPVTNASVTHISVTNTTNRPSRAQGTSSTNAISQTENFNHNSILASPLATKPIVKQTNTTTLNNATTTLNGAIFALHSKLIDWKSSSDDTTSKLDFAIKEVHESVRETEKQIKSEVESIKGDIADLVEKKVSAMENRLKGQIKDEIKTIYEKMTSFEQSIQENFDSLTQSIRNANTVTSWNIGSLTENNLGFDSEEESDKDEEALRELKKYSFQYHYLVNVFNFPTPKAITKSLPRKSGDKSKQFCINNSTFFVTNKLTTNTQFLAFTSFYLGTHSLPDFKLGRETTKKTNQRFLIKSEDALNFIRILTAMNADERMGFYQAYDSEKWGKLKKYITNKITKTTDKKEKLVLEEVELSIKYFELAGKQMPQIEGESKSSEQEKDEQETYEQESDQSIES